MPVTSDAFLGDRERNQSLGTMDEFVRHSRGSPTLTLDVVEGDETFRPAICFMPASGRGRF